MLRLVDTETPSPATPADPTPAIPTTPANPVVVRQLEDVLAEARAGQVDALGIAYVHNEDGVSHSCIMASGERCDSVFAAAVADLQFEVYTIRHTDANDEDNAA